MNRAVIKIIAYAALGLGLVLFGILFSLEFSRRTAARPLEPVTQQSEGEPAPKTNPLPPEPPNHFMMYLGLFLGCGIALGLMAARDLSTYVGQEAIDYIFNDDGDGQRNPDHEAAEMEVTNGNPLEAIRLMRDYYNRRPREVFVALRIAELYEVNLRNPLAAALEYEEVLKKKLPPERWGWAAIHLANLYSGKLDKREDAVALLHRVVNEYGQTAAAKKARERLGIKEETEAPSAEKPTTPESNLPAGFTAKSTGDRQKHGGPASENMEAPPANEEPQEKVAAALPAGFRAKEGDTEIQVPASDTLRPSDSPATRAAARPGSPDRAAGPSNLPPGFRPKSG